MQVWFAAKAIHKGRRKFAFHLAVSTLGVLTFTLQDLAAQQPVPPDLLHQLSHSFQTLSQQVSPAVVQVLVTGYGPMEEGGRTDTGMIGKQHSLGSGVIVDPEGYIITNAHVVAGAQRIRVMVASPSAGLSPLHAAGPTEGRSLNASLVGVSKEADLAVLKIPATGLPALLFGEYDKLRQGQLVFAFGSPQGLENSVSMGVVSSVARQLDPDRPMVYIQTDAPINPGNSGGPLVDVDGKLVGINTFILTESGGSEGIGFAIPSTIVRFVYHQLRKYGHVHRGEIGAVFQSITPALAAGLGLPQDWGVMVADVIPEKPAAEAGLKIQDVVLTLDGKKIENIPQCQAIVFRRTAGEVVELQVLRNSERLTLRIPVIERHDEVDRLADLSDPSKNLIPKLGILGVEIDDKILDALPELRFKSGIVVVARAVTPGALKTELMPGDVIHSLNGVPIVTLSALRTTLERLTTGDPVVLQVERERRLMYVALEME